MAARAFTLHADGGAPVQFDKPSVVVGSGADADVRLGGSGVEPRHATFTQKGKQLFLTALVGESVFDDSRTWVDGSEARPNVAYVLPTGARLAFGSADGKLGGSFRVEFEEPSGSNPLVEMLIQGAAAGASAEVRAVLGDAPRAP
ncbi:MAG: hypothetical protein J3K34DRAFT_370257 [Monoraphidium minutum]|nr:MAG: hypothetical protein J3K34DRAFT_370257 [Monoraphidium minutum]